MQETSADTDRCGEAANSWNLTTSNGEGRKEAVTMTKIICGDEENIKNCQVSVCKDANKMSKALKININKPLIPLKIALFCWFSGCAAVFPFMAIYLKQLGLSLDQLSVIFMILPFIQFLGPTVSGILSDKFGRSKPVLQANILLVIISLNCMLFIPALKENKCNGTSIDCLKQTIDNVSMTELCNITENDFHIISCTFRCSNQLSFYIKDSCFRTYISECDLLSQKNINHNVTFPEYMLVNETAGTCTNVYEVRNNEYEVRTNEYEVRNKGINSNWCLNHLVNNCNSTCEQAMNTTRKEVQCDPDEGKTQIFILSMILLIPYNTFLSNTYRIFDVTSMSMVKTYNSDFGRQRVWSIMGAMVTPPLAGYIISAVSSQNGPQKYDVTFYLFDALVLLTMAVVWKLDITIDPPAKNMLRKTITLLRNIDILVFISTIFVIGTTWGFTKIYSPWYLEDLGAPSILLGLIPALSSLLGLPFLLTSNWFVEKVGSANLLLLALIGYVAWCSGYSFLINPWWSLIYEIFGILTYHLFWVSVVRHSHSIAPPGLTATVIATAGGVHYGLGKGSGSLIGGIIMSKYGGRMAFRVMAAICAAAAVLYALYLYTTRKYRKQDTGRKNTGI